MKNVCIVIGDDGKASVAGDDFNPRGKPLLRSCVEIHMSELLRNSSRWQNPRILERFVRQDRVRIAIDGFGSLEVLNRLVYEIERYVFRKIEKDTITLSRNRRRSDARHGLKNRMGARRIPKRKEKVNNLVFNVDAIYALVTGQSCPELEELLVEFNRRVDADAERREYFDRIEWLYSKFNGEQKVDDEAGP